MLVGHLMADTSCYTFSEFDTHFYNSVLKHYLKKKIPIEFITFIGGSIGSATDKFKKSRRPKALQLFLENGVLASIDGAPARRLILSSYQWRGEPEFHEVCDILLQGKPIVGSIPMDEVFKVLGPNEIYDFDPSSQRGRETAHQ